jgi:uncharacterized protein (TIGR00251 family)
LASSFENLDIREKDGICTFTVRLTPRSPKNKLTGVKEGKLHVRIKAPPVEGAANECAIQYLAELFDRPKVDVQIWKGLHSREKIFKIRGVSSYQILQSLERES